MGVGSFEVQPIFVHGDAALANVIAFGSSMIMPNLMAVTGIDGPNIVRCREIENAVDDEWRGFDNAGANAEGPGDGKGIDVGSVDLVERAVAAAGIVAIVGRPGIGGRFEKGGGVKALSGGSRQNREAE